MKKAGVLKFFYNDGYRFQEFSSRIWMVVELSSDSQQGSSQ